MNTFFMTKHLTWMFAIRQSPQSIFAYRSCVLTLMQATAVKRN